MIKFMCWQCQGNGGDWLDLSGEGHVEWHSCYRCGETGFHELSEEDYINMVNLEAADAAREDREQGRRV